MVEKRRTQLKVSLWEGHASGRVLGEDDSGGGTHWEAKKHLVQLYSVSGLAFVCLDRQLTLASPLRDRATRFGLEVAGDYHCRASLYQWIAIEFKSTLNKGKIDSCSMA